MRATVEWHKHLAFVCPLNDASAPDRIAGDRSVEPTCQLSVYSSGDATPLMTRSGAVDGRSSQTRRFAYRCFDDLAEIDAQQVQIQEEQALANRSHTAIFSVLPNQRLPWGRPLKAKQFG
jgi:hypothetical protein